MAISDEREPLNGKHFKRYSYFRFSSAPKELTDEQKLQQLHKDLKDYDDLMSDESLSPLQDPDTLHQKNAELSQITKRLTKALDFCPEINPFLGVDDANNYFHFNAIKKRIQITKKYQNDMLQITHMFQSADQRQKIDNQVTHLFELIGQIDEVVENVYAILTRSVKNGFLVGNIFCFHGNDLIEKGRNQLSWIRKFHFFKHNYYSIGEENIHASSMLEMLITSNTLKQNIEFLKSIRKELARKKSFSSYKKYEAISKEMLNAMLFLNSALSDFIKEGVFYRDKQFKDFYIDNDHLKK